MQLISDGWFLAGIDEYLQLRINNYKINSNSVGPTYVYLFEHKGAASFSELFKGGRDDYYGKYNSNYIYISNQDIFKHKQLNSSAKPNR